ncbi:MAG: putative ABC exporter domain-containing protein [Propionibacteriaceae bacterium]|jgi:hypothetical protein|nr:putative ABC exporter domain-containing protein [Propionibacteriaceae bacterium]
MKALGWLLWTRAKNAVRQVFRDKKRLVLFIFMFAFLAYSLVAGRFGAFSGDAPLWLLTWILFAYILLFSIPSLIQGLKSGQAIFTMSDVNLAFVSPISPRSTLMYGIVQLVKTSALSVVMSILIGSVFVQIFDVGFSAVWIVFGALLLTFVIASTGSAAVYLGTNGRPWRKRIVAFVTVALFVPLVVYMLVLASQTNGSVESLRAFAITVAQSPYFSFIPVVGWSATGATALIQGNVLAGLGFLGLDLVALAATIVYVLVSRRDYFEDVLTPAETTYERRRALSEGNLDAATSSKGPTRVRGTGLWGQGAQSLFGKHLREDMRQSRLGLLTPLSLVIIAMGIVVAVAVPRGGIDGSLIAMMLMQTLLIGTGRGMKELTSHYIYLIPESSFAKIIWSNIEIVARSLIEAMLAFVIAGVIVRAPVVNILVCVVTYTLFSVLLLGVNYTFMRLFGEDMSAGVQLMVYYLAIIVVMAPGVVAAAIAAALIGASTGVTAGFVILAGWELLAGVACFALAQGVLHNCDMTQVKPLG